MKFPKPDLSKDGLKRFALHHIEKVVLFVALVGLAAFFWLGFSTERYSASDPPKLTQKADSARSYITNNTSWEKISDLRVARDNADAIVRNARKSNFDQYAWGKFRGTAIRSLQLRQDADLAVAKPQQPEASVFRAPVLVRKDELNMRGDSKLDRLPPATQDEDDEDQESKFGDAITDLQILTDVGSRPLTLSVDSNRDTSMTINIVSVRALIDHKALWEEIESKLKESFGYYPDRDRPKYQLVQVQRKKAGGDDQWEDLTLLIQQRNNAYSGRAPEVIAPENYDAALTDNIPPIAMVDYRPYCKHSALPGRSFDSKQANGAGDGSKESETDDGAADDFGFFGGQLPGNRPDSEESDNRPDDTRDPIRLGSSWQEYDGSLDEDGPGAQYKIIRFFDFPKAQAGTEFVYRFRVWLADPNNEFEAETVSTGPSGGGARGGGDPTGGRGRDWRGGGGGLSSQSGSGGAGASSGSGQIGGLAGGEGEGGGDSKDGGFGGGRGGPPGRGGQPPTGRGGRGGRGGDGADQKPVYKKTPILPSQKHISVRKRIDAERRERRSDSVLAKFIDDVQAIAGIDLAHSRATDWTEVTVKIPSDSGAFVIAGSVSGRQIIVDGKSVLIEDPEAEVLVSDWSDEFGTLVSMYRNVRRGDWLSTRLSGFTKVLHIIDQSVRKLTDYEFRSNKFVVDIMGGQAINYRASPVDYSTPGEILVMDDDGNVFIHNSFAEKREFRNRLLMEDESAEYNQRRIRRSDDEEEVAGGDGRDDDQRGRGGGGLNAGSSGG